MNRIYEYDNSCLLIARTLPGNMTYGYTYDAYGNLTGVNGAGGAVQWSLADYTGRRTVSNTILNGYYNLADMKKAGRRYDTSFKAVIAILI